MIHSTTTTSSTCSLPPISDIFALPHRDLNSSTSGMNYHQMTMDYNHHTNTNYNNTHQRERTTSSSKMSGYYPPLKAKRKRASPSQLSVLNRVFSQTYFPSTELRIELGKHLGMSPRTVQIWFQNKRQSLRSRTRRYSFSSMEYEEEENESSSSSSSSPLMMDTLHHHKINLPPLRLHQNSYYPPSPPSSTYPSPISIDSILQ
ncbi:hypothetical protein BC941DRAFT_485923 [Chlamydoabsidia padenii]|nr:hypothetical protein BC941DRAFT_485923 [Chlamydoabsidia padenii]